MGQLTKNFSLEEMCETSHRVPNIPSLHEKEQLIKLCVNVLQPLRDYVGKSIHVNSGYRNPIVNNLVKGANNSAHMLGTAADITLGNKVDNKMMYDWIKSNCEYRQLINEYDYSWVHVEYREGNNKKQNLIIK